MRKALYTIALCLAFQVSTLGIAQRFAGYTRQIKGNFRKLCRSKVRWPRISCLLAFCSPAAVAGFIVAVIVDPIYAHTRRALPHISQEILKREPSFTNRDAASAVVLPIFAIPKPASSEHGGPNIVFAQSPTNHTTCSMFGITFAGFPRRPETSTALRVARAQIIAANNLFDSTFTKAQVLGWISRNESNNSEAPKCFAA